MPHVSRIKLDKNVEERLIKTLELVLTRITKKEEMNSFLFSILTSTERLMLAKRMAAIILIKENLPQSQIAASLHLTQSTVSKLELISKIKGEGFDIALRILKKEKIYDEIKNSLIKIMGYSIRAAGGYVKPTII